MEITDLVTWGLGAYFAFSLVIAIPAVVIIVWIFRRVIRDTRRFDEQWDRNHRRGRF